MNKPDWQPAKIHEQFLHWEKLHARVAAHTANCLCDYCLEEFFLRQRLNCFSTDEIFEAICEPLSEASPKRNDAMKAVRKIEFTSDIIEESSMRATAVSLGRANCIMEFFIRDGVLPTSGEGEIEWHLEFLDECGKLSGEDDVEYIGVRYENGILTDYEGVFQLPPQAIELIRAVGISVPEDFA